MRPAHLYYEQMVDSQVKRDIDRVNATGRVAFTLRTDKGLDIFFASFDNPRPIWDNFSVGWGNPSGMTI